MTNTYWMDIDAYELFPGQFVGQPLTVTMQGGYVFTGAGASPAAASLAVRMEKK